MNFGCPVPKVTRKGGGCRAPRPPTLLRDILPAAVARRRPVPVTIKFRIGRRRRRPHLPRPPAASPRRRAWRPSPSTPGRPSSSTAAPRRWDAIAPLKAARHLHPGARQRRHLGGATMPWRWCAQTGCDGVVVGRGCLGRPWLFRDLDDAFAGRPVQPRHAWVRWPSHAGPRRAAGRLGRRGRRHEVVPQARRLVPHRLPRGGRAPQAAATSSATLADLEAILARLDPDAEIPHQRAPSTEGPHQRAPARRAAGGLVGWRRRPHATGRGGSLLVSGG